MTTKRIYPLVGLALTALATLVQAQPAAHYPPGIEGILSPVLPPPGLYFRDYNYFYTSGQLNDQFGNNEHVPGFSAFTYAQVPRLVWISDVTFLGGNLGSTALLPIMDTHIRAPGKNGLPVDNYGFGVGDLFWDVLDTWHWKQFDFVVAPGMWFPTGASGAPADPGLGYFTGMLTIAGTYYPDEAKTWSLSAVNRYEWNTESPHTDITTGQVYTVDWGIGKEVWKPITVGVSGYYQTKVTEDSGPGALPFRGNVLAVGPEVQAVIPQIQTYASLRWLYEFAAEDRAQGNTIVLTLTRHLP